MKTLIVVGAQWGDEGKGKLINFLAQQVNFVIRWSAGNNAGHTITTANGQRITLSALPTGILNSRVINVIGPGSLVNLTALVQESKVLQQAGYQINNLLISERSHLIFPYHIALDLAKEKSSKSITIGTTGKGIGPCCQDRIARTGIRVGDLKRWTVFVQKLKQNTMIKNQILTQIYHCPPVDIKTQINQVKSALAFIKPRIVNVLHYFVKLAEAQSQAVILCEGAQGALLDLDFGTYPYVTSSRPLAPLAVVGSGLNARASTLTIGTVKAYNSRVGRGPFPTEIKTKGLIDHLVIRGCEFGSVTQRQRRVGWLDLVALRHSCWVNGYHMIAIMLLDVLTGLSEIKVCTAYLLRGHKIRYVPSDPDELKLCVPYYTTVMGWSEKINQVKSWSELPPAAQKYLTLISDWINVPLVMVSVGPQPDQMILLSPYYEYICSKTLN